MRSLNKLISISIFFAFIMFSCVTEKQRAKICATCPTNNMVSVTKSDSVSVTDSLAKIKEKDGGDVNFSFGSESEASECDSIKKELSYLKLHPFIKHENGVTSSIKTDGKKITFNCKCDSAELALKKLKIEHWALINSSKEDQIITNNCPPTWWETLYKWGFWIMLILLLIILGINAMKFVKWLGTHMP